MTSQEMASCRDRIPVGEAEMGTSWRHLGNCLARQFNEKIWDLIKEIPDPEIPVITLTDLGIVKKVESINLKVSIPVIIGKIRILINSI